MTEEKVYTYYPGCALGATGKAYAISTEIVAPMLGMKLRELEDWNCCGATAYMSVRELTSFAIAARNLALAEPYQNDLVTPCSACYTVLNKTNRYLREFPDLKEKIDNILAEVDLKYSGTIEVRHLFNVMLEDVGIDEMKSLVKRDLKGLKVACYYGCQLVRPFAGDNEDEEMPEGMDQLVKALGAEPVYYPMKTKCCGGALIGTSQETALRLIKNLLMCARQNQADCIITPCPLCQINLDAYQSKVEKKYHMSFSLPILFHSQLIGLAIGAPIDKLGLETLIVPMEPALSKYAIV